MLEQPKSAEPPKISGKIFAKPSMAASEDRRVAVVLASALTELTKASASTFQFLGNSPTVRR